MIRAFLLMAAATATGAVNAAESVRFIACPVYRDTDAGRKSGCWLAVDPASGLRYDITGAPTKADWNRAVLVEGRAAAEGGDPCGGIVLEPVRVSILETSCPRHLIRAEGYKVRKFALPERNVRPLYEARKKPAAPYAEGRFSIPFDYRSSFIVYQLGDYYIDAAINYALDVQPALVEISAAAQTRKEAVSGEMITEPASLARDRAEIVRTAMLMRGISASRIRIVKATAGPLDAEPFDGLETTTARRADIRIIPQNGK